MSKRKTSSNTGTMLELWRPPRDAGAPIGCVASTYTFAPGLFEEQCLARFLGIESDPNREDLAFMLERESLLGGVYAGVLVDYTQAGVEHSLRWDVLPVRIRSGKQHAKISLLVWQNHIRIIVASANISEPGYRTNYEVATTVDLNPDEADSEVLADAVAFLRSLISFVPGSSAQPPEIMRAEAFLKQVERQARGWKPNGRRSTIRRRLVCTLPDGRSSLEEAIETCRRRGESPHKAWIASPFFDPDKDLNRVAASLCKLMARGRNRKLRICVPAIRDNQSNGVLRIAAPISLVRTPLRYQGKTGIEILPDWDADKNHRYWHAKMLGLFADRYSALMIGSSNFTCAGMGVGHHRNAEANLLTVIDSSNREMNQLGTLWPEMEKVADPESAEWLGINENHEEEELADAPPLPAGFLSATFCAGDNRSIILRLDPACLPADWSVHAYGRQEKKLLSASDWSVAGQQQRVELTWSPLDPPEKLLIEWGEGKAFLPLNVDDSRTLPAPAQLEHMSADDMLSILAASDPSAAYRAWAKREQPSGLLDDDLDAAVPIDLNPLHRYDLQATFLHRIRRRARVLAQLRVNLEQPVWSRQSLDWRLRGFIGIEPLAERLLREVMETSPEEANEALLTLADFLIVLREIDYQPVEGALKKPEFDKVYHTFLKEMATRLANQIVTRRDLVFDEILSFWERVVKRCQE